MMTVSLPQKLCLAKIKLWFILGAAVGFVDNSILTHKLLTVNIGIVSGLLQYTTTVQIMLNVTIQLIDGKDY